MLKPPGEGWTPVQIGESNTSVYHRGDVYAKCCDQAGVAELAGERDRIAWLAGTGLPGATVKDWLASCEGACLITSAVTGLPGTSLPSASHERAMRSLGRVLRELHSLPDCPFSHPLDELIATATDVVRRGAVNPKFLTDEWRKVPPADLLAEVVAERPYVESVLEPGVCHGDACLPNFVFDPETLEINGLIDVGRLGVGDRYCDLALMSVQLDDEWSADPAPFFEAYGVPDPDPRHLAFHRLLDPLTWPLI